MGDFPEAREYYLKIFSTFEKEGSGHILVSDVGPALQMCGFAPSKAEIEQLERDADKEGDGKVSSDTFLDVCTESALAQIRSVEDLKDAFRVFDGDGKTYLSQSDLRFILTTLGEKLTDQEMNGFLAECLSETDTDGNVSYESVAVKFMPACWQL